MTQLGKGGMRSWKRTVVFCASALVLTGCQTADGFNPFKPNQDAAGTKAGAETSSVRLVERDVEAPDVFQKTDKGLWDGRPSLGGVWVAHPDVKEPERVIIRNTSNSNFVIGALFRRERENPGPVFQVSSDAAAALGMLAGAPVELNVTALRREEAPQEDPAPQDGSTDAITAPQAVETSSLDPVAGAAAAIDAADEATATAPEPSPQPSAPPRAAASSLEKPFIQIGIFSVEENAENTATAMRQNGMVPTIKKQSTQGKTFWRVIVGPATSVSERSVLLEKIKGVGFEDAYPVTN